MATGLDVLQAITAKRRGWPPNAEFRIRALDALALLALSTDDLLAEKFPAAIAEQVMVALKNGDIMHLGQRLGVKFIYSEDAAPLVLPKPASKPKQPRRNKKKLIQQQLTALRTRVAKLQAQLNGKAIIKHGPRRRAKQNKPK